MMGDRAMRREARGDARGDEERDLIVIYTK